MNEKRARVYVAAARRVALPLVCLALLGVSGAALAADGAAGIGSDAVFPVADVLQKTYESIAGVFRNVGVSPNTGKVTILALYTMSIALGGLKIAGGMDPVEAVIAWVKLSMLAAFALAAVQPMPWLSSLTGGDGTVGEVLRSAFIKLGNGAVAGSSDGGSAAGAASALESAAAFMQTIFRIMDVQIMPPDLAVATWMAKLGWLVTNLLGLSIACLMLFFTVAALAVAGALVVGEVFFSLLSMDLAIAMAPLLVPWVLFPPLSWLFDAWLRTILIGGMTYVVGALVAKGAAAFASTMVTVSTTAFATTKTFNAASVSLAYGGMFLASMVFVFIAMKVSSLAGALISGSGVSGVGILGFKMATGGVGGAASSPFSAAGKAGGRAAAGVAGRGVGVAASAGGGKIMAKLPPKAQAAVRTAGHILLGTKKGGK